MFGLEVGALDMIPIALTGSLMSQVLIPILDILGRGVRQ